MSHIHDEFPDSGFTRIPKFTAADVTIVEGWCAYEDKGTDVTTVKGKLIGFFNNEEDAKEAARGHGWYGGYGIVEETKALKISDTVEVFDTVYFLLVQEEPVKVGVNIARAEREEREAALKLLTPRQKMLLGIKD